MIKSVGMTPKSFKKSIYLENIRYGVMALVWGLPVSLGLDYLMYKILGGSLTTAIPSAGIIIWRRRWQCLP